MSWSDKEPSFHSGGLTWRLPIKVRSTGARRARSECVRVCLHKAVPSALFPVPWVSSCARMVFRWSWGPVWAGLRSKLRLTKGRVERARYQETLGCRVCLPELIQPSFSVSCAVVYCRGARVCSYQRGGETSVADEAGDRNSRALRGQRPFLTVPNGRLCADQCPAPWADPSIFRSSGSRGDGVGCVARVEQCGSGNRSPHLRNESVPGSRQRESGRTTWTHASHKSSSRSVWSGHPSDGVSEVRVLLP